MTYCFCVCRNSKGDEDCLILAGWSLRLHMFLCFGSVQNEMWNHEFWQRYVLISEHNALGFSHPMGRWYKSVPAIWVRAPSAAPPCVVLSTLFPHIHDVLLERDRTFPIRLCFCICVPSCFEFKREGLGLCSLYSVCQVFVRLWVQVPTWKRNKKIKSTVMASNCLFSLRDWRNGSVVMSIGCPSRRSRLDYQHHVVAYNLL